MLASGARVSAFIPQSGERVIGTICGPYRNPKVGGRQWLLVTDQKSSEYQDLPDIGIPYSTVFIDVNNGSRNEVELLDSRDSDIWLTVQPQVGVYTVEDFEFDEVHFPAGTVGRVVRFAEASRIEVMWNLPTIPSTPRDKKYSYLRPWEIPVKYIAFGTVDLGEGRLLTSWAGGAPPAVDSKPKFKVGDTVAYMSSRALRVAGKDDRTYAVVKGTILTVTGTDRGLVTATVIGNCQDKVLGAHLRTDTASVMPFSFVWIPEGKKVRVTKEIMFRKKSLQDKVGVVLSSTDQDGDVGVQFSEDIGAGSLDGLGHDGRCLFIPAQALEVSG